MKEFKNLGIKIEKNVNMEKMEESIPSGHKWKRLLVDFSKSDDRNCVITFDSRAKVAGAYVCFKRYIDKGEVSGIKVRTHRDKVIIEKMEEDNNEADVE